MTVATRRLRAAEKLLADVQAITSKEGITPSAPCHEAQAGGAGGQG
jgi:hypothetical protein